MVILRVALSLNEYKKDLEHYSVETFGVLINDYIMTLLSKYFVYQNMAALWLLQMCWFIFIGRFKLWQNCNGSLNNLSIYPLPQIVSTIYIYMECLFNPLDDSVMGVGSQQNALNLAKNDMKMQQNI